ncbi:MAG TPA: glycosyltransferase family 9 protein [Gemmatimonadales bacterium]|nr:glycosyltransferase family 9 protein [Gemmatimonadales bacterium]
MSDWGSPQDLSKPGFLAIAERGIGDALTLLPSLRSLRAARPELRIELLAPGLFPLAANVLDTATILDHRPLADLSDQERLAWLEQRQSRWVWNTEGERGPWTQALRGVSNPDWRTAPPQRKWGGRHVIQVRSEQLRALFPTVEVRGEIGLVLTPAQEAARRAFRAGVPPGETLVAIHPGAAHPDRVWPADKFRSLAAALAERPGVAVFVFVGDAEAHFGAPGYLPERGNLRSVREPLDSAVAKLAACDLLIGNESGFYHLAFALGLKVAGVFRSLRGAQRWAYRSPRSRVVISWMPRPFRRDWATWISVARVLRAARKVAPGL